MATLTHIETDTGTNVDISSATAIGSYTSTGDKLVMVDVSIDAVAGNGDYVMYVKRQINGAGSSYIILPKTTMAAASGETAISGQSGWITVRNGDVLTVYVDGLADDTSTPDYTTRWYELAVQLVTLADDAITASKFDESTAFPLKAADTGSTQVARTGADGDTLETLSDEIATVQADLDNPDQYKADVSGIPAAVWGYATRTLSSFGTLISDIWAHATRTLSAFGFTVATQSDANVTAIKAKTDNLPAAPANEATLTAIKGAGWTDETLVALMTAIENISAGSGASAQEVWEYATRTLTGLPALPTDWITAASLKADAVTEIQSGLATAAGLSTISGLVDDLESRLTAARAGYLDKLNVAGELANTSNADAFKADTVSVPQNVWSYHTRLLTNIGSTIESPTAGDPLNIYRDTTVLISLTNLGAIGVDDKLWFTVKDSVEEPDENSIIQIDRLGLLYINGAPASQVEDGSITVLDDVLGNVEIKLAQRQAALLPLYEAYPAQWDIKILHSGIVSILNIGTLYIKGTPTRAIL